MSSNTNNIMNRKREVFVFKRLRNKWTTQAKLTLGNNSSDKLFGVSTSLFGNRLLVGAPEKYDASQNNVVHYYKKDSSDNWVENSKITIPYDDTNDNSYFGNSVSLYNNTALIGAPKEDISNIKTNAGASYLFDLDYSGNNWSYNRKITADNGEQGDLFGSTVKINNSHITITANGRDVSENNVENKTYIYDLSNIYLEKAKTRFLNKGFSSIVRNKILNKNIINNDDIVDLSDIAINTSLKRHEALKLLFENNSGIKRIKTKTSDLSLNANITKQNVRVFKKNSTIDLRINVDLLNSDEGFYANITDEGESVFIKTSAGNFTIEKLEGTSYKIIGYPFLSLKYPSSTKTVWEDGESVTVNGISIYFGGVGGNGGNDNEMDTSLLYLPVYLDSSKNVIDNSSNAIETLDSSYNFVMTASSFTADKLSQFIKFKKNGNNYTYKFDSTYDTIVKNAIRQDLINQNVTLQNNTFISGQRTHSSTLGGYFVQYISDIIMGHPQAQMFIKNDQNIIDNINKSNINEQFNEALKTNLTNNSFTYNEVCDSILKQLISDTPSRFLDIIDDTEYDIPYQKDDYFVIFVKISGNIDLEERSTSNTGNTSNYNILKNLYSSNIYLTFNDAVENIKTNQSIWRLIIQLA